MARLHVSIALGGATLASRGTRADAVHASVMSLQEPEAHHLQLAKLVNAEADKTDVYFILTMGWKEKEGKRAEKTRNESPTNVET